MITRSLLLSLLLLPLAAQEAPVPAEETTPVAYNQVVRFYTWPLQGILHDQMSIPALPDGYVRGENGVKEVVLARGSMSPPFRYRGSDALELVTRIPDGKDPETGKARWKLQTLAQPEIPREWKQAVVVLFPDSTQGDGTWRSLPLETGDLKLPKGGSRYMNTSRRGLVLEVDGKQQPLAPGESMTLSKSGSGKDRVRLRMYGRNPRTQEVELIYTASHWRKQESGNLYVIYASSATRLKVLQLSPEDMEEQKATQPAETPREQASR